MYRLGKESKTMARSVTVVLIVSGFMLMLPVCTDAAVVSFREGGGSGYTDMTFDQTDINPANDDVGNCTNYYTSGSNPDYTLIGFNDLLSELPLSSGDQVVSATLTIKKYQGDGDTVYCARVLTNWLPNPAGGNQCNVTGQHADLAGGVPWAAGAFSSADYDGTNIVSNTWGYTYAEPMDLDVTEMIRDMYDTGEFYGLVCWANSGTGVYIYSNSNGTDSKRPVLTIEYNEGPPPQSYMLTVHSGSGSGTYYEGTLASISADPAPFGHVFDEWAGDTVYITDVGSAETTVNMPAMAVEVTATYAAVPVYDLTVYSGSGDGQYIAGEVVEISADPAPSGYVFQEWTGDVGTVASTISPVTTLTMPAANTEVTASYMPGTGLTLTVHSGSGDGSYTAGATIAITADPAPSGYKFNMWVGDLNAIADRMSASTTFTMPAYSTEVTATYCYTSVVHDWWPAFEYLCRQRFGAEIEPLTYEMFGTDLQFMAGGEWTHASRTSACVAFETNLPAKTYVEYGTTTSYGSTVHVETDNYYYIHVAYLKNLDQNTTYHYRLVAEDERGNVITSGDKVLTTSTPSGAVLVSSPQNLTQSGKTYILTQDVVADYGAAFEATADNITFDLDGHTIIYNNISDPVTDDGYNDHAAYGIKCRYHSNFRIYNGTVIQGPGNDTGSSDSRGFNPVYTQSVTGEIAGVTMIWAGSQVGGLRASYGDMTTHHNVAIDLGGELVNRHAGPYAMLTGRIAHHNLIKRARQRAMGIGLSSGGNAYHNEIYVDSVATNSFGLMYYGKSNCENYGNRIFGTGYLMIGIGTVSGCTDIESHDNFIHLHEMEPDNRWPEYGAQSGGYCCRITWGGDNLDYHDNIMITYAQDGGMTRGTWFYTQSSTTNVFFRDNIIKEALLNEASTIQGCIVVAGDGTASPPPHIYENNRIISNSANIRFGESYGTGCNTRFYDNTFVKEGPVRSDYRTIQCGYGSTASKNHELYDSSFEGGASYDAVTFAGSAAGSGDFYVGWTLTVETEPFADVTITDATATTVFTGQANDSGIVQTRLLQYKHMQSGKTYYTPHSVTADNGVVSDTVSVNMNATKTIQIPLVTTYTLTVNSGSGGGDYAEAEVVPIVADPPPSGSQFDQWTGDVGPCADVYAASTTYTMPAAASEITATYKPALAGDLDGSGFVGQADLDIVLDQWGRSGGDITDPRADVSGDNFVGQDDLDIVLDDWGQTQ